MGLASETAFPLAEAGPAALTVVGHFLRHGDTAALACASRGLRAGVPLFEPGPGRAIALRWPAALQSRGGDVSRALWRLRMPSWQIRLCRWSSLVVAGFDAAGSGDGCAGDEPGGGGGGGRVAALHRLPCVSFEALEALDLRPVETPAAAGHSATAPSTAARRGGRVGAAVVRVGAARRRHAALLGYWLQRRRAPRLASLCIGGCDLRGPAPPPPAGTAASAAPVGGKVSAAATAAAAAAGGGGGVAGSRTPVVPVPPPRPALPLQGVPLLALAAHSWGATLRSLDLSFCEVGAGPEALGAALFGGGVSWASRASGGSLSEGSSGPAKVGVLSAAAAAATAAAAAAPGCCAVLERLILDYAAFAELRAADAPYSAAAAAGAAGGGGRTAAATKLLAALASSKTLRVLHAAGVRRRRRVVLVKADCGSRALLGTVHIRTFPLLFVFFETFEIAAVGADAATSATAAAAAAEIWWRAAKGAQAFTPRVRFPAMVPILGGGGCAPRGCVQAASTSPSPRGRLPTCAARWLHYSLCTSRHTHLLSRMAMTPLSTPLNRTPILLVRFRRRSLRGVGGVSDSGGPPAPRVPLGGRLRWRGRRRFRQRGWWRGRRRPCRDPYSRCGPPAARAPPLQQDARRRCLGCPRCSLEPAGLFVERPLVRKEGSLSRHQDPEMRCVVLA